MHKGLLVVDEDTKEYLVTNFDNARPVRMRSKSPHPAVRIPDLIERSECDNDAWLLDTLNNRSAFDKLLDMTSVDRSNADLFAVSLLCGGKPLRYVVAAWMNKWNLYSLFGREALGHLFEQFIVTLEDGYRDVRQYDDGDHV